MKEVPWLLTKKERGRKKENVQKNEPATVAFQGGRNDHTEADQSKILSLPVTNKGSLAEV